MPVQLHHVPVGHHLPMPTSPAVFRFPWGGCSRCCPPQTEYARLENGRFVYRIHRSPMCEYMINFIHKLKHLPEKYMMNSVLENFTILQVLPLLFQGAFPTRGVEPALALTLPSLLCAARPRGTWPWHCKYTGCACAHATPKK